MNYGFRDNPSAELGLQFQFVMHELLQEHDKASSFIDLGPLPFDPADALKWPLKCAWRKRTMDGAAFKAQATHTSSPLSADVTEPTCFLPSLLLSACGSASL